MTLAPLPSLETELLTLVPITAAVARAVIDGDSAGPALGAGYPHADSLDALRLLVSAPPGTAPPSWFVALRETGEVIGDCGTKGWVDNRGAVEIGYGLAGPWRGRGLGREAVAAMVEWLVAQPDVRAVVAEVEVGNEASRRLLEGLGFHPTHEARGCWWFERQRAASTLSTADNRCGQPDDDGSISS